MNKLSYSAIIVVLSILCSILLIDKIIHEHVIFHNDSNVPMEIGARLILEDIDKDGTFHIVREEESNTIALEPQLIWNADDEGIPTAGHTVMIEQIVGNYIYLAPIE